MTKNQKNAPMGALVAGIAGMTAAAVGAYYLYGHKNAEKNRRAVKGWMLKAKGEVLEELEGVQEVTKEAYEKAVDAVLEKYNDLKNADPEEISAFFQDMKTRWDDIHMSANPPKKRAAKTAKKPASRAKKAK